MLKTKLIICFIIFLSGSFKNITQPGGSNNKVNVVIAIKFIDAFYSFNHDSLASILSDAVKSQPEILYYQKWAECGNYKVLKENDYIEVNDSMILCPITVKDDLIGALKIKYNVTDTFHLTIREGHIRSVTTSSNDPAMFDQAKEWLKKNRPELIEEPCEGMFEGGPTPCECVKAMVKGFTEFISMRDNPSEIK